MVYYAVGYQDNATLFVLEPKTQFGVISGMLSLLYFLMYNTVFIILSYLEVNNKERYVVLIRNGMPFSCTACGCNYFYQIIKYN